MRPEDLEERLQHAITSNPYRASLVQAFVIDLGTPWKSVFHQSHLRMTDVEVVDKLQSLVVAFRDAFMSMKNLKHLEFHISSSPGNKTQIAGHRVLALGFAGIPHFPFRLHTLVADFGFTAELEGLCLDQTSLKSVHFMHNYHWVWRALGRHHSPPLDSMPQLECVECEPVDLASFVAGRPVKTITTRLEAIDQLPHIISVMHTSLRAITKFDVEFGGDVGLLLKEALDGLASANWQDPVLPAGGGASPDCLIEALVLRGLENPSQTIAVTPASSVRDLRRFPFLRTVQFRGGFKGMIHLDPSTYAGPRLVEVRGAIEEWGDDERPRCTYVKKVRGEDGVWSLENDEAEYWKATTVPLAGI